MSFRKHGTGDILPQDENEQTESGRGVVPPEFDQTEHLTDYELREREQQQQSHDQ